MKPRLFDAHCDTAYELWSRGEHLARNSCHIDLEKAAPLRAYAQVFAFCSCAGTPVGRCPERLLHEPLAYLQSEVRQNAERIAFAASPEEVTALTEAGKIAALLSVEGPEVIRSDPAALAGLREAGFIMTTLTWNAGNALAGTHGSNDGLTTQGADFVREAQRLGIAIDVSHLSEAAFWDLMRITRKPILASHSNCRALCENTRNLTDDQLRAIADTDGAVGLNLMSRFWAKQRTLQRCCAIWSICFACAARAAWCWAVTWTAATGCRRASTTCAHMLIFPTIFAGVAMMRRFWIECSLEIYWSF